jgi:type II secretory pathway pseudopilin PulG
MAKMEPPTRIGKRLRLGGVAYLALLIVIAAMGAALAATGNLWHQVQQREKERELLFIGTQFRRAIKQYYERSPGEKKYPLTLDVLLLDERTPAVHRYLRRPYRDPFTHLKEWGLVLAPQGGSMGVHSLAQGTPIKQANFPVELNWEGTKSSYVEWQFTYWPSGVKTGALQR